MIDFIRGKLISISPGKAVVEVGAVGFSLEMPPAESSLLNRLNEEVVIYTRLQIKEDEINLYGFESAEERKLFNLILSVSGFGPRLALSLLAIFTVSQLYSAVMEENIAQLSRAHGVGKKAAQRLILELKEKLPKTISTEDLSGNSAGLAGSSHLDEISEALIALGYSPTEAVVAVKRVCEKNSELSREEMLKAALKNMTTS